MAVVGNIRPLGDKVIVTDMNFGEEKTKSGIVLTSDDGKSSGLHPRWCRVLYVGKDQTMVKPGQWLLMQHGRWARGHKHIDENGVEMTIRLIDNDGIILISDEEPTEDAMRMSIGAMNFNIPG